MSEEFGFVPLDTSGLQLELDFSSFLPPEVLASLNLDTPPATPDTPSPDPTTDTGGAPLDPGIPVDPTDPGDASGGASGGAPLPLDVADVTVPVSLFGTEMFAL